MVSPIKIYSLSHLYLAKEAATNTFIHSLIYTSPKGRRQTHLLKTMMFLIIIFIIPQNMPHVKQYFYFVNIFIFSNYIFLIWKLINLTGVDLNLQFPARVGKGKRN